jgi:acyl carrier protein
MAEKQALRREDAEGGLSRDAVVDDLRRQLVELSEGRLAPGEIDPSGHLLDHGYLDSLSAVMFLAHVSDRYGVQIEDVEFVEELNTLDAIATRLGAR